MKPNFVELRSQLDLESKYVEFSLLRTALTVVKVVTDLEVYLIETKEEGEFRGTCPKCQKERSFALNINTNRFNCFNKSCILKGGGVIDFVGKFLEVTAKEASHLLACAYGIQPYSSEPVEENPIVEINLEKRIIEDKPLIPATNQIERKREAISRAEFDALREKVERLSMIVWSNLFEAGEIEAEDQFFADELRRDEELETAHSG